MRYLKKMKNGMIKGSAFMSGTILITIMSGIDCFENLLFPIVVMGMCCAWLFLLAYANGFVIRKEKRNND